MRYIILAERDRPVLSLVKLPSSKNNGFQYYKKRRIALKVMSRVLKSFELMTCTHHDSDLDD